MELTKGREYLQGKMESYSGGPSTEASQTERAQNVALDSSFLGSSCKGSEKDQEDWWTKSKATPTKAIGSEDSAAEEAERGGLRRSRKTQLLNMKGSSN